MIIPFARYIFKSSKSVVSMSVSLCLHYLFRLSCSLECVYAKKSTWKTGPISSVVRAFPSHRRIFTRTNSIMQRIRIKVIVWNGAKTMWMFECECSNLCVCVCERERDKEKHANYIPTHTHTRFHILLSFLLYPFTPLHFFLLFPLQEGEKKRRVRAFEHWLA